MIRLILIVVFINSLFIGSIRASETDNYTVRDLPQDGRQWLNSMMNKSIQEALKGSEGKSFEYVHRKFFQNLGGLLFAKIEKWSNKRYAPAVEIPIRKSIYRDVIWVQGIPFTTRWLTPFYGYYSPRIYKINNVVFGDDKLGHFVQLGYYMYLVTKQKEQPNFKDNRPLYVRLADWFTGDRQFVDKSPFKGDDLVLALSHYQEDEWWGIKGTMARSYADIAANWEGYHFWSQFTEGTNPYLKQDEQGRWQQVREFDWAEYINPAWDEFVNHTDYHPRIATQVQNAIKEIYGTSCPIDFPACQEIFKRYGDRTPLLLNKACQIALHGRLQD